MDLKRNILTFLVFIFSFSLLCSILIMYAGLIPLGHWQDEYSTINFFLNDGLSGLLSRLYSWSPRPLSELLIYTYSHLVNHYNKPFITESLSFIWIVLSAGFFVIPLSSYKKYASLGLTWQSILLSLALYCLMLAGHPVAEFFYWPQGAVAYIPVVAMLCAFFWILILYGVNTPFTKTLCSSLLILSALSAEVGAMLVFVFASIVFWGHVLSKCNGRHSSNPTWMISPFFISIIILLLMFFGRYESKKEIFGDANIAHHLFPALYQSIADYIVEFFSVDAQSVTGNSFLLGVVTKILFFFCIIKNIKFSCG